MAKITVSDVKSVIDKTSTTQDTIIQSYIDNAYGKLDIYCGLNSGEKFTEYGDVTDDVFELSGMAKDIALTVLKLDGETADTATDIEAADYAEYEIIGDDFLGAARYYAEYTSTNLLARVKKILMEIIIFELYKLPAFHGTLFRKSMAFNGGAGTVNEYYISDEEFYKKVSAEFSGMFFRGLA